MHICLKLPRKLVLSGKKATNESSEILEKIYSIQNQSIPVHAYKNDGAGGVGGVSSSSSCP